MGAVGVPGSALTPRDAGAYGGPEMPPCRAPVPAVLLAALVLAGPAAAAPVGPTGPTGPTGGVAGPEVPVGPGKQDVPLVPGPKAKGSYVARVVATTYAKTRPWGANRKRLAPRAPFGGGANQLMVLDSVEVVRDPKRPGDQRLWIKVALPQRPNGSVGWVPADYLSIRKIRYRIHISTQKRMVQVYRDGRLVRRFGAVVGAPGTPTPHGLFATNEQIRQPDPTQFLGPWAFHLTAYSNVLDNYGGGPGRVAIHGRAGASLRDPIGTARSHGCVRIRNADIRWLARRIVAGTPVRIAVGMQRGNRV